MSPKGVGTKPSGRRKEICSCIRIAKIIYQRTQPKCLYRAGRIDEALPLYERLLDLYLKAGLFRGT